MNAVLFWAQNHPEAVWLIFSAFLSAIFSPKTPEQLEKMPRWAARTFGIAASFGVDVPKLIAILRTPKNQPLNATIPPPPMAPKEDDK